ncbi:DNA-binding response regulator [Frankia sp. AgB1.9]|uniref:LuxR C-terminal-related transcriptional regulator n=1 Tax=unclassified Frankia TaxID=2632575 RepID=UPI001932AACF|nr:MULTISPECIES: LuxR C-terminal-related transcriptional regulator [unclassified Frankia]MBL7490464.1 DNA-binding response regulator [Frankia sp. AgW1.1]MBL7546670.1 DNA-binding response regulator [Frankia sp. AgB1.9]MBL7622826.1 hypothetical protein [Frankia sp. AgB1.8]
MAVSATAGGDGGLDGDHEILQVAVVEDHEVTRLGFVQALARDRRLRVVADAPSVRQLLESGAEYEVCLADLVGVGTEAEFLELVRRTDVVVCTAAEQWRALVAPWVQGARAVYGKKVGPVTLADAVWDARHRPFELKPHLASALTDAVRECGLKVSPEFGQLLALTARGRRVAAVRQQLAISDDRYLTELERLRKLCSNAGLGELDFISLPLTGPQASPPAPQAPEDWAALVTTAERRTLEYCADGFTEHEIATETGLSYHTVVTQIRHAMDRFGIQTKHADLRLIFAMYVCSRHSRPEVLLRRLKAAGAEAPQPRR